jgi:hypothetical protein
MDVDEPIASEVVDAVLQATVMVVFANIGFFTHWYCLRELNVALAAFNALVRHGQPDTEREAALYPLVVAMLASGGAALERLPSGLRGLN